ncbi:MAG TPA: TlpA disulfide reductase family protein [Pseudonocardiaceae bacterium]
MSILGVAVCLLAVLTLLNLFVLLGVVRRLRATSHGPADAHAGLPDIGSAVPHFSESTVDGGTVTDGDLRDGPALLLFLSPGCEPCRETAGRLERQAEPLPVRLIAFVLGRRDEPAAEDMLRSLAGAGTAALIDERGSVTTAFGVSAYPTAVMVDAGLVAATSFDYTDLLPAREALAR